MASFHCLQRETGTGMYTHYISAVSLGRHVTSSGDLVATSCRIRASNKQLPGRSFSLPPPEHAGTQRLPPCHVQRARKDLQVLATPIRHAA